jgi:hypothetical protein
MHGTCKYCGCTQEHACPGGCSWIDDEKTICSACIRHVSIEELMALGKRDMLAYGACTVQVSFSVARLTILCQALIVTLMVRENLQPKTRNVTTEFLEQMLGEVFAFSPALRETLERDYRSCVPAEAAAAR